MKKVVLIVAGGEGKRMGSNEIKQFLVIGNYPVLMYSVYAFYNYDPETEIILTLPKNEINNWKKLCDKYNFNIKHKITAGGDTRFHSVKNGISVIDTICLIAVHDGVRPLIDYDTIDRCFKTAGEKGTAVPVIGLKDSIRKISDEASIPVNRKNYVLIQTPQVFKSSILVEAYKQDYYPDFTDDASVVEKAGYKIELVAGNEENIKITTCNDLLIANALIEKRKINLHS